MAHRRRLLGLDARAEFKTQSAAPLMQAACWSLILITTAYAPQELLTGWLATVAESNPVTHVVEGARQGFIGESPGRHVAGDRGAVGLMAILGASRCAACADGVLRGGGWLHRVACAALSGCRWAAGGDAGPATSRPARGGSPATLGPCRQRAREGARASQRTAADTQQAVADARLDRPRPGPTAAEAASPSGDGPGHTARPTPTCCVGDAAAVEVVGRELDLHPVPGRMRM